MNCYKHHDTVATGTCKICGKGLCSECGNRFSPPLCENCLLTHNQSVARKFYMDIFITILIFLGVVGLIIYNSATYDIGSTLKFVTFAVCAYWGWQFLNRFSVPIFFMSGFGLLLYFAFKLSFSIIAGIFITPIEIFKRVKEIIAISKLKKNVKAGLA